jgi:hypothetical protein
MDPKSEPTINQRQATARYEALARAVGRAIDEADPIGLLQSGCPADEYSPEIGTIVPRVIKASGPAEVRRILHEEFLRWFGERTSGPEQAYEAAALRVWQAVLTYRETETSVAHDDSRNRTTLDE